MQGDGANIKGPQNAGAGQRHHQDRPHPVKRHHMVGEQDRHHHHDRDGNALHHQKTEVCRAQRQVFCHQYPGIREREQIKKQHILMKQPARQHGIGNSNRQALQKTKHHVLRQLVILLPGNQQLRGKGTHLCPDQGDTVVERVKPHFAKIVLMRNEPDRQGANQL